MTSRSTPFLIYEPPSRRFNLVSGVEVRDSAVQLEMVSDVPRQIDFSDNTVFYFGTQVATSQSVTTSAGAFVQASFWPREDFKVVAGGRFDTRSVRSETALLVFNREPAKDELIDDKITNE